MAVSHTTALELIGKYVSFDIKQAHTFFHYEGVVSSLVFEMDGSHSLKIGYDDNFLLSDVEDLKILGELRLYSS